LKQYGVAQASEMPLQVYEEACRLDQFEVHAGDAQGVLKGTCLDSVAALEAAGVRWTGDAAPSKDGLAMSTQTPDKLTLHEKQTLTASAQLKDGRVLDVRISVLAPRPKLVLMSKVIEPLASPIHLDSPEDLPVDARLHFRLKSEQPSSFGTAEKVEVASADGFYHTELSLENGGLMRQNPHTVMATLEIAGSVGASSFGALRFRPLAADGVAGDWQPLATLVRLPVLTELHCPAEKDAACTLSGNNLFLIESVASDADFQHATQVSESAMDEKVEVPRPQGKLLYVKLRDDPSVVHVLAMPIKKDMPVSAKGAPKDVARDVAKDAAKDTSTDTTKDTEKDPTKGVPKELEKDDTGAPLPDKSASPAQPPAEPPQPEKQ
jgi:hypothetical protein